MRQTKEAFSECLHSSGGTPRQVIDIGESRIRIGALTPHTIAKGIDAAPARRNDAVWATSNVLTSPEVPYEPSL